MTGHKHHTRSLQLYYCKLVLLSLKLQTTRGPLRGVVIVAVSENDTQLGVISFIVRERAQQKIILGKTDQGKLAELRCSYQI